MATKADYEKAITLLRHFLMDGPQRPKACSEHLEENGLPPIALGFGPNRQARSFVSTRLCRAACIEKIRGYHSHWWALAGIPITQDNCPLDHGTINCSTCGWKAPLYEYQTESKLEKAVAIVKERLSTGPCTLKILSNLLEFNGLSGIQPRGNFNATRLKRAVGAVSFRKDKESWWEIIKPNELKTEELC